MAFLIDHWAPKDSLRRNDNLAFPRENTIGGAHKWTRMNSENDFLPTSFHKPQNNYKINDASDREEILECFNKKFTFKPPENGWTLPLETEMFKHDKWHIDSFMELKDKLNEVKNKLNNYNLDDWHKHTKNMNKAGNLLWAIKKNFAPEFVTQAWLKFYEICCTYDFVCKSAQEECYLNSVHLCEAPGAFITSLNHYIKLNHPDMKWDWISTTLNPHYEGNPLSIMINDDRFILHTPDHWKFGEDYTGNLMDVNNMVHFAKEAENLGRVLLITADGSIDCQRDPGEQEQAVSQLVYCEIVTALHILSAGGNFVVKMFTMYEQETICLVYLLTCCFETVNVYKPVTSKEGNSENYVICINYKGIDVFKPWLRELKAHYGGDRPAKAMFGLSDIPQEFLDQLYECAKKFKDYQVEVIERNIYLYQTYNQQSINRTRRLRYVLSEEFIRRCNLRPLNSKNDEIVREYKLKRLAAPERGKKGEDGSFNDKMEREKLPPLKKMKMLFEDVHSMEINWEYDEDIKWLQFPPYSSKVKVIIGKSVTSVHSSKFCSAQLLQLRDGIRKIAKDYFPFVSLSGNITNDVQKSNSSGFSNELGAQIKSIIQKSFPLVGHRVRILNFQEKLWGSLESGRNELCESNAFFGIMEEMEEKMWRGYSLILQGYPMLTQFTAGVVYTLGHLFEKVGFVRPTGQDFAVIFREYRGTTHTMNNIVRDLESKMDLLETTKNRSVLSLVPIWELIYGHNEFYPCVTAVNNLCVKEQICDIVDRVTNPNF